MNRKLDSRCLGEISIISDMQMITLMAEIKEELKSLQRRVKEESEKANLKLSIQNTKIMAFGLIFSCQTDGKKMEVMTNFIFLSSKITAETAAIKLRHFLLGRTAMKNLDTILKSRDLQSLCRQRSLQSKLWFFQQSCMDMRVGS